jgi:hypothetical protein
MHRRRLRDRDGARQRQCAHACLFLFLPATFIDQMKASLPRWFQHFIGLAEVLAAVGLRLHHNLKVLLNEWSVGIRRILTNDC